MLRFLSKSVKLLEYWARINKILEGNRKVESLKWCKKQNRTLIYRTSISKARSGKTVIKCQLSSHLPWKSRHTLLICQDNSHQVSRRRTALEALQRTQAKNWKQKKAKRRSEESSKLHPSLAARVALIVHRNLIREDRLHRLRSGNRAFTVVKLLKISLIILKKITVKGKGILTVERRLLASWEHLSLSNGYARQWPTQSALPLSP